MKSRLNTRVLDQPNRVSNLGHKLKHELRELIPVTVFFFVAFQLLALTQALMLEQYAFAFPLSSRRASGR